MLKIGSVIDKKYKILSEVGHGGMSTVYLAINERANKTWAVKEVRKDGTCDFEAVKQGLIVETDMLKKFNHPHLPSIIDVIDMEDSFIIVMDYIEGRSLKSVLDSGGAQNPDQVIEWGKQICDVLEYLHNRKPPIIYRDMKPANLMLKPDGNIMLIDFGTAREFKNRAMVEDTTCLGTRGYAAPEQFGGMGETTPRTDIYCTGATLYHLLTGHSPAEPPYEIKPLSYWNPGYAGSGLEKLILKCCQIDPDQRYQTCGELMYALENVHLEDDLAKKSRNRKWWAFLSSAIVCMVALGCMFLMNGLKSGAEKETYDSYVQKMEALKGKQALDTIDDYCEEAISIQPERPEAYNALVDEVIYDFVIEDTENYSIQKCFHNHNADLTYSGNIIALKAEAPSDYGDLCYDLGLYYYFMPEAGVMNFNDQAEHYFSEALSVGQLTPERTSLAENVVQLIKLSNELKSSGENRNAVMDDGEGGKNEKLRNLWNALNELVEGIPQSEIDNPVYKFRIYQKVANLYDVYSQSLSTSAGVPLTEIEDKVQNVLVALQNITYDKSDNDFNEWYIEAENGVRDSLRQINTSSEKNQ